MERGGRGAAGVTIGSIKTQDKENCHKPLQIISDTRVLCSYYAGPPLWVLRRIPFKIVKI